MLENVVAGGWMRRLLRGGGSVGLGFGNELAL
jgi:hypothetical protein